MNETFYDAIGSIFNPANNPFFSSSHNTVLDDNIEDAIIIDEDEQ
jgi:hypothetical protein